MAIDDPPAETTSDTASTAESSERAGPSRCHVIHDEGSERGALRPGDRREAARERLVLLARSRPARARTTSRSSATSSSSIRSPSRTPSTSASARRSTTTTTSSSSSSTAPSPTTTGSSRCTASTPSATSSPCTATTAPAFAELRRRYAKREKPIEQPSLLLYRIVDGLVDSFFPILADFDDRIDELEDAIFLQGRRHAAAGDLPDEAAARRDAQGGHPAARHVRAPDGRRRRAARPDARRTSATSATSTTT